MAAIENNELVRCRGGVSKAQNLVKGNARQTVVPVRRAKVTLIAAQERSMAGEVKQRCIDILIGEQVFQRRAECFGGNISRLPRCERPRLEVERLIFVAR